MMDASSVGYRSMGWRVSLAASSGVWQHSKNECFFRTSRNSAVSQVGPGQGCGQCLREVEGAEYAGRVQKRRGGWGRKHIVLDILPPNIIQRRPALGGIVVGGPSHMRSYGRGLFPTSACFSAAGAASLALGARLTGEVAPSLAHDPDGGARGLLAARGAEDEVVGDRREL